MAASDSHSQIVPSSRVRRSAGQLSAEVDGEVVLMGVTQGKYYGLDAVGSVLWRRLDEWWRVDELCAALAEDYEGDAATIETDVVGFLTALEDQGLVEVTHD